jgi:hypothetical protein
VCLRSFPRDFPDTSAGLEFWHEIAQRLQEEHDRKPKAKRFAYEKLGVVSPFEPKWSTLYQEADAEVVMQAEAEAVEEETSPTSLCVLRGSTYMEPFCFSPKTTLEANSSFIPVAVPTLVSVVASVLGRGNLSPNTMVSEPPCFR